MRLTVSVPRTRLLRGPSKDEAQETELLFGHPFHVEDKKAGWLYGRELSPLGQDVAGYAGWVKRKHVTKEAVQATHYISVLKAPIFKREDIKSRVKLLLPMGAQIKVKQAGQDFAKIAGKGFVHLKHICPVGEYKESDFVSAAEAYLGLPYLWAGVSTDGLDCSGLVQSSLRATGRDCLRDAGQQEQSLGTPLAKGAALKRGDLVFWPGHVGIMTDAKTLLHANAFHMCVAAEPVTEATARIGAPRRITRLSGSRVSKA